MDAHRLPRRRRLDCRPHPRRQRYAGRIPWSVGREQGRVWFIEKWSTSNRGLTWAVEEVCRSDTVKLVRPYCPLNGSGVVFTRLYSYAGYRSFDADMVWRP